MARRCTVCDSPHRDDVDRALVGHAAGFREIALRHGLGHMAVYRHAEAHLPADLADAQEAAEVARADNLLGQVRDLIGAARDILEEARADGDRRSALQAIDTAGRQLTLLAKLAGELDERPVVNIVAAPQWVELRTVVIDTLDAYPEARAAVAARLLELEAG